MQFSCNICVPTPQLAESTGSRSFPIDIEPNPSTHSPRVGSPSDAPQSVSLESDVAQEWLNPVIDDDSVALVTVIASVNKLIMEAKHFKSFTSLMHLHAVKRFIELRDRYIAHPKIKNPITKASLTVATSIGKGRYFARKIRHMHKYIDHFRTLPPVNSGKHHAHPSLLNNEDLKTAIRRYLTVLKNGEITPLLLMKEVNNVIIPGLGLDLGQQKISERCARRWLIKLGYGLIEVKKEMYVDGHERDDVVEYRKEFLNNFMANERLHRIYTDTDLLPVDPNLQPGEQLHVPIFHNESIFRSNDLRRRVWVRDGHMPLQKKGQGRAIHVSDFTVEQTGRLNLNEEQMDYNSHLPPSERLTTTDAREIIYPGKNHEGWWNTERLIEQVKKTIPIFERMYPGAIGEFIFDQSSAHAAFGRDSLTALFRMQGAA
ncbi:hypothetical protein M422DRAFT_242272 [Sphaerobolus stellatus SS14]|nr:hypothetical protein M422DRAFT_242272 [Sphaerobolus stellatus SS14]